MKGFDSFYETISHCFLKYENDLYCTDTLYKYTLKWNGEEWEEFEYTKIPNQAERISPQTASEIATVAPWDTFDRLKKRQEETEKRYWENLIKTTKHKVIGYINTAYGSDLFLPMENGELTDEEYAAIIKDYKKNGYFYSGEDFQDSGYNCTPVLDNYRWIDFSRRGFGGLIAHSKGDYSEMGYCHYTESMFINREELKFPNGKINKGITHADNEIAINSETFDLIKKELKSQKGNLIAVPIQKDTKGFYWIGDGVTLCFCEKRIKAKVKGIINYNEKEEFAKFSEYRQIKCVFNEKDLDNPPFLLVLV